MRLLHCDFILKSVFTFRPLLFSIILHWNLCLKHASLLILQLLGYIATDYGRHSQTN